MPHKRPRYIGSIINTTAHLLHGGRDCGFAVIEIEETECFLQIRKYIRSPGDFGLEFEFPNAGWSHAYFDQVYDVCARTMDEVSMSKVIRNDEEFLKVDFGQDFVEAADVICEILSDVFDVNGTTELFVGMENVSPYSPFGKLIDR